jgi:predicted N-acetyltransferase YhbS
LRFQQLGRLAVLPAYRSHKLGAKLVARVQEYAVEQAKAKGASEAIVMCHSQVCCVHDSLPGSTSLLRDLG